MSYQVATPTSAAPVGLLQFHIFQSGEGFQYLARLRFNALRPVQVAGVMIGDNAFDILGKRQG